MTTKASESAIFLDRDGTLNVDVGYLDAVERLELIPGAVEAVRMFNRLNKKVIVVSNQSGVARGYFDEDRVREIHAALAQKFARAGAAIDAFYYCPHHPTFGKPPYLQDCDCRKPRPGMFVKAAREHNIDLTRSFMIGDKYSDVEAGKRLQMTSILVLTGSGKKHVQRYKDDPTRIQPDIIVKDVWEAAQYIATYESATPDEG